MTRPALPILRVKEDLLAINEQDPEVLKRLFDCRVSLSRNAERRSPYVRAHRSAAVEAPMFGALELLNTLIQPGDLCLVPEFDGDGYVVGFREEECKKVQGACRRCNTLLFVEKQGDYACPKCGQIVSVK